jgi:hypothetical protein
MKKIIFLLVICSLFFDFCKAQWVPIGPAGGDVKAVTISGSRVFAGTEGGVFISSDFGQTWTQSSLNNKTVSAIAIGVSNMYAGTNDTYNPQGVFLSSNNGQNWIQTSLNNRAVTSIVIKDTNVIAGTSSNGIYISSNNGQTWTQTLNNLAIYSLYINGPYIYAGCNSAVYISSNNGQTWTKSALNHNEFYVYSLAISGSYIFAGISNGASTGGVYLSSNNGQSWLPTSLINVNVNSLSINGSTLYAGINYGGVYYTTNNGNSWIQTGLTNQSVLSLALNNTNIFAGTGFLGLYISSNSGQNWTQCALKSLDVFSLTVQNSTVYAGSVRGIYSTSNNGQTWLPPSLPNYTFWSMAANAVNIFAGTRSEGLYVSSDHGQNWVHALGMSDCIASLAVDGSNIFAGTGIQYDEYIYHSTNNGLNWSQTSTGSIWSIAINGNNIIAGSRFGNALFSTNNGLTWTPTSMVGSIYLIGALIFKGSKIFAGAAYGDLPSETNGVFVTTNNGLNWSLTSLNNTGVYSFVLSGNAIIAGTDTGIYLSTNDGLTWIQKNEGMGNFAVTSLVINSGYIYAATIGSSVWYRPLSELVGIEPNMKNIPDKFTLSQNYPNPFNPTTKIKFDIPAVGTGRDLSVQLRIYDILGREVSTLVNEQLKPGTYEVEWDGSNYPSGVYFYKLITDSFSEAKRMVLIK